MPEAVSFLQIKIIQVSLFLPKPMAKSLNRVICQLDMVLCKEQLENKEPRQKQVLEYEGGSGTEGLKVAWKLRVLVAPGAFPHSSSATALTQGFSLLRADSTSALKNRGYWRHSHVHLSLMCAKVHSRSGNLQPIHRLQLSKGVLTHSKESPEHPTVTMSGNCLSPFQQ